VKTSHLFCHNATPIAQQYLRHVTACTLLTGAAVATEKQECRCAMTEGAFTIFKQT